VGHYLRAWEPAGRVLHQVQAAFHLDTANLPLRALAQQIIAAAFFAYVLYSPAAPLFIGDGAVHRRLFHCIAAPHWGFAIVGATDDELVEAVVPPAERRLDDAMQVSQGVVAGDQEPPPDGRVASSSVALTW
jgi:hypothetical protein